MSLNSPVGLGLNFPAEQRASGAPSADAISDAFDSIVNQTPTAGVLYNVDGMVLRRAMRTLTRSEILNLNSTPIVLTGTPPADVYNYPVVFSIEVYLPNGVGFAGGGTWSIAFENAPTVAIQSASPTIAFSGGVNRRSTGASSFSTYPATPFAHTGTGLPPYCGQRLVVRSTVNATGGDAQCHATVSVLYLPTPVLT
jgi:hypothetical protein